MLEISQEQGSDTRKGRESLFLSWNENSKTVHGRLKLFTKVVALLALVLYAVTFYGANGLMICWSVISILCLLFLLLGTIKNIELCVLGLSIFFSIQALISTGWLIYLLIVYVPYFFRDHCIGYKYFGCQYYKFWLAIGVLHFTVNTVAAYFSIRYYLMVRIDCDDAGWTGKFKSLYKRAPRNLPKMDQPDVKEIIIISKVHEKDQETQFLATEEIECVTEAEHLMVSEKQDEQIYIAGVEAQETANLCTELKGLAEEPVEVVQGDQLIAEQEQFNEHQIESTKLKEFPETKIDS